MINKTAAQKLAGKPWALYVVDVADGKFDIKASDPALTNAGKIRNRLANQGGDIRLFTHFGLDLTGRCQEVAGD